MEIKIIFVSLFLCFFDATKSFFLVKLWKKICIIFFENESFLNFFDFFKNLVFLTFILRIKNSFQNIVAIFFQFRKISDDQKVEKKKGRSGKMIILIIIFSFLIWLCVLNFDFEREWKHEKGWKSKDGKKEVECSVVKWSDIWIIIQMKTMKKRD